MKALPKINTLGYGGRLLAAGIAVGGAVPLAAYLLTGRFYRLPVIIGGILLAVYAVLRIIENRQDNGSVPHYEKTLTETIPFDPETAYAVVRSSICTGEKVAGFKDRKSGHFTEVMVIRAPEDLERFKKLYDIDSVKTEY